MRALHHAWDPLYSRSPAAALIREATSPIGRAVPITSERVGHLPPLRRVVGRLRAVGSKRRTVFVGHARASMTLDVYSHVMPLEECEPEALQTRIREASR
jgi:hypothetical protein